ncbi:MAG: DUF2071 domain-containing protein [Bacteroidota bacterium]
MAPFLTAVWQNLILITYHLDPDFLADQLPAGLEPDIRDGRAFCSLVAFEFCHTRLKGIPIPFHLNFPEINFRVYVRKGKKRGVYFIKELVPKYCIAAVARRVYNEPYESIPMTVKVKEEAGQRIVRHDWYYDQQHYFLEFTGELKPALPSNDSTDHFFKEHEWGFGVNHKGQLMEYQVTHPEWHVFPLKTRFEKSIQFGAIYGSEWAFLNDQVPYHLAFAEGSAVAVFPAKVVQNE